MSYNSTAIGENFILVNYGRLTCGSEQWGPGFSNDTDVFGRSWQSDSIFIIPSLKQSVRVLSTAKSVSGADQQPNYFPMKLYQKAVTVGGTGVLEYELPVDAKLDYLVWLHFAEIDSSVKKAGQRVFDVVINGNNATRIDIFAKVGSFAAYSWSYTMKNLSSSALSVKLVGVVGSPLLSGLENYALVPRDLSTAPEQGMCVLLFYRHDFLGIALYCFVLHYFSEMGLCMSSISGGFITCFPCYLWWNFENFSIYREFES